MRYNENIIVAYAYCYKKFFKFIQNQALQQLNFQYGAKGAFRSGLNFGFQKCGKHELN